MDATLTQIGLVGTRRPLARTALAKQTIRRVLAAIAAGSDHPAFRTPDAPSHVVLTTRGEQDRLLNAGICVTRR